MIDIYSFVKQAKHSYSEDYIDVVEGYEFSQKETINLVDLMVNSKFKSGLTDELGREKPYLNIVKSRLNVSVRATDLDTKDIQIKAGRRKDYWKSFLLGLKLKDWMKKSEFAKFLNKANEARARYGTAVIKKVKTDGKLTLQVVPWLNLITDQVDIWSAPIIERHYYSPSQLRRKTSQGWDSEMIEDIIEKESQITERKVSVADDHNQDNETNAKLIEIFEVHGELPNYLLEDEPKEHDDTNTSFQMHIIHLERKADGKYEGRTIYSGEEDEIPYKTIDWDTQDGRALGVGVVEDLFEAQIWTNYTVKQAKDMNDLASKIIFQKIDSEDEDSDATNLLTDTETGDVLDGRLMAVQTNVGNFTALQNVIQQWELNSDRVASTFEAKTGETLPSGTPYRQAAILNQEANSHFAYRRENFGIAIKEIIREWVIPHLLKEISKDDTLALDLEPNELQKIDDIYATYKANQRLIQEELKGNMIMQEDYDAMYNFVRDTLEESGVRRFIKTPEDFTDTDMVWEVDILITGEEMNKAATLESISTIIGNYVSGFQPDGSNPYFDDPTLRSLLEQAVELSGAVSPLSMYRPRQKPNNAVELASNVAQQQLTNNQQQ